MTPKEQAAAYYEASGGLDYWIRQYGYSGVVVDEPGLFILAKPICSTAPIQQIEDSGYRFPKESWDAWYLQWMSGSVWLTLKRMPFPLRYAAFHRRDEERLRLYPIDRLIRLALRANPTDRPAIIGQHVGDE